MTDIEFIENTSLKDQLDAAKIALQYAIDSTSVEKEGD